MDALVEQILARAGDADLAQDDQASDYDWNRPHAFTPAQLERISQLVGQAAGELAEALNELIAQEFELTADEPAELYAADVFKEESDDAQMQWALLGDDEDRARCAVGISSQNASTWVAKLLGGQASGGRTMSTMEMEILSDVFKTLTGAFSAVLSRNGYARLQCLEKRGAQATSCFEACEEMLILVYKAGDEEVVRFAVSSAFLSARAGAHNATDQQDRRKIVAALQNVRICAEVILGSVSLPLRDVADLSVGDVLITDTAPGQPVNLTVDSMAILSGFPARFRNCYALKVAGWVAPSAQNEQSQNEST